MSEIKIEKVESRGALNKFLKFPRKIYGGDPNWVPHLLIDRKEFFNPKKNPFFEHARVEHYLAYKNGDLSGRISAIINDRHNEFHDEKTGFFGFFECINDKNISTALYDTAADFIRKEGMELLRGPCNFSTNDEVGFLLEGFDSPPSIMNTHTPKYYLDLAEDYGLEKAMDVIGYYIDDTVQIPERMLKIADRIRKREDLVIRNIIMKDLEQEVERVKYIYNKAWEKNWGFVPLTNSEIDHMAASFKLILDPEIVHFAEVKGEPVGFSLSLPNINEILIKLNGKLFPTGIFKLLYSMKIRRSIKGIRTIIMGMIPEYRGRGIDNLFYIETIRRGINRGYKWSEMGWILETNALMLRALDTLGGHIHKKYRLYQKKV
ncbi:MAG: hypothetical protein GY855_00805 [candidate division Zixibacteria bacterium]|nr:hypothetical protein [candidate division Zixibacteria bacterium]